MLATARASDAFQPKVRDEVFATIVGAVEVDDCILKCRWLKYFLDSILRKPVRLATVVLPFLSYYPSQGCTPMVTPACVAIPPTVTTTGTAAPLVAPAGTMAFICSRPITEPTSGPA